MTDVAVVDYGMGNLRSVAKAIEHVAPRLAVAITSDPGEILGAARVVFPGQGAMPDCMREMDSRGLRAAVVAAALEKPFLGICIGLQMLFERSEEGDTPGLQWLDAEAVRFNISASAHHKVPHMGWNRIQIKKVSALMKGVDDLSEFYFAHSYHLRINHRSDLISETEYGVSFPSAVERNNIIGVQ